MHVHSILTSLVALYIMWLHGYVHDETCTLLLGHNRMQSLCMNLM